jgi:hypothetical protein
MDYHTQKYGPDPDFIITTSCRRSLGTGNQQDQLHSQALIKFEATLRDLEQRFGPAANGS